MGAFKMCDVRRCRAEAVIKISTEELKAELCDKHYNIYCEDKEKIKQAVKNG